MYVCCCEPSLDMYALCGPKTYGPFVCDLLLHTYAYVDFALMYGWIYVVLDICLLVMVMYCWIGIFVGYMCCWIDVLLYICCCCSLKRVPKNVIWPISRVPQLSGTWLISHIAAANL